jgi:hypothetical protein
MYANHRRSRVFMGNCGENITMIAWLATKKRLKNEPLLINYQVRSNGVFRFGFVAFAASAAF